MEEYLRKKIYFFHFLGMVFVLYIHAGLVSYGDLAIYPLFKFFFTNSFCRVFQPIFFGLSGYLFFQNISCSKWIYIDKVKRRFFSLFIPYIFFNVLWGVLIPFFHQCSFLNTPWFDNICEYFTHHNILQTWFYRPALGQLWFLRDLMICVMLTGPLFFLISKTKKIFFVFLFVETFFLLFIKELSIGYSLISFSIGAYISIEKIDVQNIASKKMNTLMLFVCLAYLIGYGVFSEDFHNSVFLFSWSLFYLLWIGYDKIPFFREFQNRLICKLGASYSFFTYLTHDPLLNFINFKLKFLYYGSEFFCFTIYLLLPLGVYTLCICFGACLKKVIPCFYEIIAGGR